MIRMKYYLSKFGYLIEVMQNPCGCHPFDLLITYSNKVTFGKGNSVSISFKNQRQINLYLGGYEELK